MQRISELKKIIKPMIDKELKSGIREGAHSWHHLESVERGAVMMAEAMGIPKELLPVVSASALMHDLVRAKEETTDSEKLSQQKAKEILENQLKGKFTVQEKNLILRALNQETVDKDKLWEKYKTKPPQWKDATRKNIPEQLTDAIRMSVHLADGIEKWSPYVVARRAQYVSGTRHHETDIKKWLDEKGTAKVKVGGKETTLREVVTPEVSFLLEGYIRRFVKVNFNAVPKWMKPGIDGLLKDQRRFIRDLYKGMGLTEKDIVEILSKGYPKTPKDVKEQYKKHKRSWLHISEKEIKRTNAKRGRTAIETVRHFAKHKNKSTPDAIKWFRKGMQGKRIDPRITRGLGAKFNSHIKGTLLKKPAEHIKKAVHKRIR